MNPTSHNNPTRQAAEALEVLLNDIECFLKNYCDKLDQATLAANLPKKPTTTHSSDVTANREISCSDDWTEERSRWELQRNQEQLQIQEQLQQLESAWLRLEDEQRRFLQTHQAPVTGRGQRMPVDEAPNPSLRNASPVRQTLATTTGTVSATAVEEFQRLKQELQNALR